MIRKGTSGVKGKPDPSQSCNSRSTGAPINAASLPSTGGNDGGQRLSKAATPQEERNVGPSVLQHVDRTAVAVPKRGLASSDAGGSQQSVRSTSSEPPPQRRKSGSHPNQAS